MRTFTVKSIYTANQRLGDDLLLEWFLGEDSQSGDPVEIAQFKSDWMTDGLAERLIPIAERLRHFHHESVHQLLDFHYESGQFFLIYEALPSSTNLDQFLYDNSELPSADRYEISKQLFSALCAIENSGFTYGFLNPTAVRMTANGKVKCSNVALSAMVLRYNWDLIAMVEDGLYLSPEFIQRGKLGSTSDVYSMGMMLYFLFLGKLPYPNLSSIERIKKALIDDPISFMDLAPKAPEKLGLLIHKAIEKDAENRFGSMAEMAEVYLGTKEVGETVNYQFSRMESELAAAITASHNRNKRLVMKRTIIGGFALAIMAGLYISIHLYVNAIPEVNVPNLVGKSAAEATEILAKKGLKAKIEDQQFSDKYPEGTVLDTTPKAGMRIKEYRTIGLIVSQGMENITVPELTGRSVDEAQPLIEKAGYKLEIEGYDYSTQPKGEILVQDPEPYSQLPVNESIRVRVSNGYPVHFSYEYNTGENENLIGNLFQKQPKPYFDLSFTLEVLPNWDQQLVSIYYVIGKTRAQLYSRNFMPGELQIESFRVDQPGVIEVYFGDTLAMKEMLHRTQSTDSPKANVPATANKSTNKNG